jgi:uncharacterized coiled-coil DUF342 family protein
MKRYLVVIACALTLSGLSQQRPADAYLKGLIREDSSTTEYVKSLRQLAAQQDRQIQNLFTKRAVLRKKTTDSLSEYAILLNNALKFEERRFDHTLALLDSSMTVLSALNEKMTSARKRESQLQH